MGVQLNLLNLDAAENYNPASRLTKVSKIKCSKFSSRSKLKYESLIHGGQ